MKVDPVRPANATAIDRFASTSEGAELVKSWGGKAGIKLAALQERTERLMQAGDDVCSWVRRSAAAAGSNIASSDGRIIREYAMSKLGPREAQLRALKETRYEERQQRRQPAKPVPRPKTVNNASSVAPVTNSVTNAITNSTQSSTAKAHVFRWRAANPDRYRIYMRDLMRRLRAERRRAMDDHTEEETGHRQAQGKACNSKEARTDRAHENR
jgi:hypothetical protein